MFIVCTANNNYNGRYTSINNHRQLKANTNGIRKKLKQDNTSELWSNAFNFKKSWGSQVDPRTGVFSTYIKGGSLLSNFGHGPNIDLKVLYSSNAFANKDGLGAGWSWNLTHFNLQTHQLTTSFGQNFYLQQQAGGRWWPLYHKLHDMYISGDINTHFVITYANGLREILNHDGYEIELEQQDGWRVYFVYKPGTHLLQSVTDDEGHAITLHYKKNKIIVVSRGTKGELVSVFINHTNNHLSAVTLPLAQSNKYAGIFLYYKRNLLAQISYPGGLKKEIVYNCTDAMKIDTGTKTVSLCVVSAEKTDPGIGQPMSVEHYQYSAVNGSKNNYLGYNSGLSAIGYTQKDILFDAPSSYTYHTQKDNGIVKEIQTYNKYHLLIDTKKISDKTGSVFLEVHNFFCRTDEPDGCAHTAFSNLPSTYSLPLKTETYVWGSSSSVPSVTSTVSTYNERGRLISFKDEYGRLTKISYCPVTGNASCPAIPKNWSFGAPVESVIRYPAPCDKRSPPAVRIYNYYHKVINHTGSGYILMLDHQIYQAGQQKRTMIRHYYRNVHDPFSYGLLKQIILTGNAAEDASLTSLINNYYYIKSTDGYRKTSYTTTVLGDKQSQLSSAVTTSLFTNQLLKSVKPDGRNITLYHYDLWGRLIQTDFAVSTSFATSRYYQYTISNRLNQVIITAPNGLQNKIIFDGAGRTLMSFDEALTADGRPLSGQWWLRQSTAYNRYGQIASYKAYQFDSTGKTYTLTAIPNHDYSGRATSVHLSNGETDFIQYEDAYRCVVNYQRNAQNEYSVLSVSRYNLLNKPVKYWILPAPNRYLPDMKTLCLQSDKQTDKVSFITYDGFGRAVSQNILGRVTRQYYNALGQLTDTVNPVGNRIHKTYDLTGHITAVQFFDVYGNHYLLASAYYNAAGQLMWKSRIEKGKSFYHYTADGLADFIITATRHRISWKYNAIGLPVAELVDGKKQWTLKYDPVTALVTQKTDNSGTSFYGYSADGMMQSLVHKGKNNYPDYTLQWKYDNNRHVISVTDISGNVTNTIYDEQGRVKKTIYSAVNKSNQILSSVHYDGFSRIKTIYYGSGMQRNICYDNYGHQQRVTDTLENKIISQWFFGYDRHDNITTLYQKKDNDQYGIFNYKYDLLNNLITMTCHGSAGLPLCPRDTVFTGSGLIKAPVITHQNYNFTALNQLKSVVENLQDQQQKKTGSKRIAYEYTNPAAPLRIQYISTAWNQNTPTTKQMTYDSAGNMTTDIEKNHITYNAFNQVAEIITYHGYHNTYIYDGNNQEVMEKYQQNIRYLFYRSGTLINEKLHTSGQSAHTIGYQGVAKTTDGIVSEYYEKNYKGDVVSVLSKIHNQPKYKTTQYNVYSPYGMVWHQIQPPTDQTIAYGFDGERTDVLTGWQFLGAGNRIYNPQQRYFLSEDPLGVGYCFAGNNPVMNADPDGNMPRWLGTVFKWAGYIGTAGLGALHNKWVNLATSVVAAELTIAALG
ncbi:MAG: hypothetical protein OXC48_11855, partial [Endozoicomonadaceae bacterium]|nr:hypothetical protein [Endozoicomonadaceae bacterium]